MRKLFTTYKYKKYHLKRSKKKFRLKVKRKDKIYVPNKSALAHKNKSTKKSIINIKAPITFSLIENCEEVLDYLNTAKKHLENGNPICFDISEIQVLTTDAIALLIAHIKDESFHQKRGIMGNTPNDPKLKELFLQSGFYNYVRTHNSKPQIKDTALIHKITNNKVEPKIAKEACIFGLEHAIGNNEIFDPIYDIIVEIMQNTNNHAGNERGKYNWWIHIYNDPITKTSKYTFLDLGIGIFDSLPARSFKEKTFKEKIGYYNNTDLIKPLFNGEIKSRTGKPERGKGIPQVYESSKHPNFCKFILVTNDVFVNLKNLESKKINQNFKGTLFYWELTNK